MEDIKVDKVEEVTTKVEDFWGKHNLGTRVGLITFIILLAIVILYPIFAPAKEIVVQGTTHLVSKEIPHYDKIVAIVSDLAFWAFAVVTVGANTLVKLADAWVKVKQVK